jgi:general L-amino acid transport system substrate-binding protein
VQPISLVRALVTAAGLGIVLVAPAVDAGPVLDAIRQRGHLVCGIDAGVLGFMQLDNRGRWSGLAVDICRAVSAALLGDATRVRYVPLTPLFHLPALQSGDVDMLAANTTYTLSYATAPGVTFAGIYYYDGQGIVVPRKLRVRHARQLGGAAICVQHGSSVESSLSEYFAAARLKFKQVAIARADEARAAYLAGRCDALSADFSALHAMLATIPDDHVILPQALSKSPLGPVVRQGDEAFVNIVRWALLGMIAAEEDGITSGNIDRMLPGADPTRMRLLGVTPGIGTALGLPDTWFYAVVKQVGNYGESYDRNLGDGSPLKIPRSLNAQWTKGGLLYAPPIR